MTWGRISATRRNTRWDVGLPYAVVRVGRQCEEEVALRSKAPEPVTKHAVRPHRERATASPVKSGGGGCVRSRPASSNQTVPLPWATRARASVAFAGTNPETLSSAAVTECARYTNHIVTNDFMMSGEAVTTANPFRMAGGIERNSPILRSRTTRAEDSVRPSTTVPLPE